MSEPLEKDDIQGLLAWGYGHLPSAAWHLLKVTDPAKASRWLAATTDLVTTADGDSPTDAAVNIAVTPTGITAFAGKALGKRLVSGFSTEFRAGMTDEHRRRLLGDEGETRDPSQWVWGKPGEQIDVIVLLYATTDAKLAALERKVLGSEASIGVSPVRKLATNWLGEREHFGFHDGISQPAIAGLRPGRPEDTIAAGEFILGYENEYGKRTDRPLVAPKDDPNGLLPTAAENPELADLGRNGSYLVVRHLSQDVPGFWQFADEASRHNGGRSPGTRDQAREALAARIVGRWPSGAPLTLAPDQDDPEHRSENDFGYHGDDAEGLKCPVGAHVRRANPRDSLDPRPGTADSIAINKRHRLLRRGRTYGEAITPAQALAARSNGGGDADERGLLFACLCGNLARQFEFVQHTWVNNPKFAGLYEDPDPLLGPEGGTLTIQARPVRRRVTSLPEFVSVRGGAYFFLPGVRALRYLAAQGG